MIVITDDETKMVGTIPDLMVEICSSLHHFYEMAEDEFNKEVADRLFVLMGKVAYQKPGSDDEDLKNECRTEFTEIVKMMAEVKAGKGME